MSISPSLHFHLGVEAEGESDSRKIVVPTASPTDSLSMEEKLDRIMDRIEQLNVTNHDSNAILRQLMHEMETRVDTKLESLRSELVERMEKKQPEKQLTSPKKGTSSKSKKHVDHGSGKGGVKRV